MELNINHFLVTLLPTIAYSDCGFNCRDNN